MLACCGLLPVRAEEELAPVPPPPSRADRLAQLFMVRDIILKKYDTNDDGVIDGDEKKVLLQDAETVRKEARKKFMEKYDLDKDGKLSSEEHRKLHEQFKNVRSAPQDKEKAAHANGKDKKGNPNEILPPPPIPRIAVENSRKKRFLVRPSLFLLAQSLILKKYDADGNGALSRSEVDVIVRDSRKLYADKAKKLLATYDKDGDGVLNEGERKTALEAIRQSRENQGDGNEGMDDIDLFIQETYDTELMESLEEGYNLLQTVEEEDEESEDGSE